MKISTYIGISVGKIAKFILHIIHRGGTTLPGVIAKIFNKDILVDLSQNVETVLITGTNGKSTTLRILEHLFDVEGIDYFSNYEGANIETGIISTFISNIELIRQRNKTFALIECDELYVDMMCRQLHPKIILITNLYDDQNERFKSTKQLAYKLNKTISNYNSILCINKDCNSLKPIYENSNNKVIGYSTFDNSIIIDNEKISIESNLPGSWNLSNIAGAFAVAYALGIDIKKQNNTFDSIEMPYGRMEKIRVDKTEILINLTKNPISFDISLEYLVSQKQIDIVIIGINNLSGDIEDPKWIKDTKNLSLLNNFNNIWLIGNCADIIREILLKEVLDSNKIEVIESSSKTIDKVINSNSKIVMLLNYTCMMQIRNILVKRKYIKKDFWKR